ncbi:MAG: hypothetical protein WCX73_01135 [Candidatus Pacearchaeota archaeon]|jgi:ribosomal protein L31E
MAKKETEPKVMLEREYIVPLRKGWLKVPKYKRANKALKTLKEFMVRHMGVYDRDLRKIKVSELINNAIRARGMYNPLAKIKVKAKKYDNGIVRVELVDIPTYVKFAQLRKEKILSNISKKAKPEEKKEEATPAEIEKKEEAKEKEEASKEEGLAKAKMQAKEMKHVAKDKGIRIQRKALAK